MDQHVSVRIAGEVQGVFFRAHALATAQELGIRGCVRNEPDGSVYIEAEGPHDKLEEFLEWCSRGPERARVDTCEVTEGTLMHFDDFQIR